MAAGKVYDVEAYSDGNWWMIAIPEIDGLTQASAREGVEIAAADFIALTEGAPKGSFGLRIIERG